MSEPVLLCFFLFFNEETSLCFPTGAVEATGQLRGHHLHDESDPEPQHVSE